MVTSTSYSMLVHYSVFNISFYHFHFIAKPHVLSSFDQIATWLRNNIIYISLYQTLSVKFNVEIRDEKEELKFSRWSLETFHKTCVLVELQLDVCEFAICFNLQYFLTIRLYLCLFYIAQFVFLQVLYRENIFPFFF